MEQISDCITEEDIKNAEAILKVGGVLSDEKGSLPNNGGEKLLRPLGTADEVARMELFSNEQHDHNMQMKAERLGNLAIAEWLPQFQVAKVIKQNKATSTSMTLNHVEKFLFLFAEEALFLLDSKSIELRLNGTPMSLDDAFCMLTCSSRKDVNDLLCTLDEYYVYSWLMKTGFSVQRHFMPPIVQKPEPKIPDKKENDQGCSSETVAPTNRYDAKEVVKEDQDSPNTISREENNKEEHLPCRGLWSIPDYSTLQGNVKTQSTIKRNANLDMTVPKLPDFFRSTPMEIGMNNLIQESLPEGMNTKGYIYVLKIEDCYRAKQNQRTQQKNQLFNLLYRDRIEVAQKSPDWKTYKTQLSALKYSRSKENQMKAKIINKGKTKPLIDSHNDYHSTRQVLHKINIFEQCPKESLCQAPRFAFNTYKRGKSYSITFSKKYPGVPFCRVAIANSTSPAFSFNQMSQLSSDDVPIKIAVVEGGSITFFGMDGVEIPKSVFTE